MNKIIIFILVPFLLFNCSFNKDSKLWNDKDKNIKENKDKNIKKILVEKKRS